MNVAWKRRLRKLALWSAGAVALYAVLGFLIAPPIVRYRLERALQAQLGRPVLIESVRINPFALSAAVRNFALKEPGGAETFVGFEELAVNVTLSSLVRAGLVDGGRMRNARHAGGEVHARVVIDVDPLRRVDKCQVAEVRSLAAVPQGLVAISRPRVARGARRGDGHNRTEDHQRRHELQEPSHLAGGSL